MKSEVVLPCHGFVSATRYLAYASATTVSPFSFVQQVQDWGGRRWVYELEFAVPRAHVRAFDAALNRIGTGGTFLWTEQTQVRKNPPRLYFSSDYAAGADAFTAGGGFYQVLTSTDRLDGVPAGTIDSGDYLTIPTSNSNLVFIPASICGAWVGRTIRVYARVRQTTNQTPVATRFRLRYLISFGPGSQVLGDLNVPSDWAYVAFDYLVPGVGDPNEAGIIRIEPHDGDSAGSFLDVSHLAAVPVDERGRIEVGEFVSVGAGANTRLHQVVDVGSQNDVRSTITVVPPLRNAVSRFDPVQVAAPKVLLRPTSPVPARISSAEIYRFSMQAVEAL